MTSCAYQTPGLRSHRKNAPARARKYSIAGPILPDCHKLKYFLLLAEVLAPILLATGANAQHHQLARISATQHQLLAAAILRHYRQQNHHRRHQESGGEVSIRNQRENQRQLASGIARQGEHQQRRAESLGLSIRNRLAWFERLKAQNQFFIFIIDKMGLIVGCNYPQNAIN